MNGLHKDSICFYEYYLKIPDYRVPKSCKLVDSVWSTVFDVFACLLARDDEEVYWCCGRLADRSIVVMGSGGRYYHVEKGKEEAGQRGGGIRTGRREGTRKRKGGRGWRR